MHFDLIESLSLAGDSAVPNDDRSGTRDRRAWVIDGATDLGEPGLVGARGGAAWLAAEADALFAASSDAPLAETVITLRSGLAARFDAVRTRDPIGAWELPSAAFLAARLGDGVIECAWLGDCAALLRRGDAVQRLGPPGDRAVERSAAALVVAGVTGKPMRSHSVVADRRAARARPGRDVLGVSVPGVDPGLSSHACAPGDELLLMTDGFAALIDGYGDRDETGLMRALRFDGLAGLAIRLRAIEIADAAIERFPRFKASDDATALWLRISAPG